MNIFFTKQTDESTNETIVILSEEGNRELRRLETKYLATMSVLKKKKYQGYSDVEKLQSLRAKEKRDDSKKEKLPNNETRISLIDYFVTHPNIEWLDMDLNVLERIEDVFNAYLDDIAVAKQLIFSDRIENELCNLKQQRLDIDSKIKELESVKQNILNETV